MSLILFLTQVSEKTMTKSDIRIFSNQIISYKKDIATSGTLIQVQGNNLPIVVAEFVEDIDAMLVRGGFKTEANR